MGQCTSVSFRWLIFLILLLLSARGSSDDVTMTSCAELSIDNGAVYRTTDSAQSHNILVECYEGFKIKGNSVLKCEDGWVGLPQVPSCYKITYCPFERAAICGDGGNHGDELLCDVQSTHNDTHLQHGDKVFLSCNPGYMLSRDPQYLVCSENGEISLNPPSCITSGGACTISQSNVTQYFLDESSVGTVQHGASKTIKCKDGYEMKKEKTSVSALCLNNVFEGIELKNLCSFRGFNIEITHESDDKNEETDDTGKLIFDKNKKVTLVCLVNSQTGDGLPFPDVTWVYPTRLRDYVEHKDGDSFIHHEYNRSAVQAYENLYFAEEKLYKAKGTITLSPTMDVHTGQYTCVVKLVDQMLSQSIEIKIRNEFATAMYFLLIVPVVLFIIVHCFYRKANTMNPFPTRNKLTRDMMQEVDKRKKLEELRSNPAYKNVNTLSGAPTAGNARGRRGAVVDI